MEASLVDYFWNSASLLAQLTADSFASMPMLCAILFHPSTASHGGSKILPAPQALVKISKASFALGKASIQAPPSPSQQPSQTPGSAAAATKPSGTSLSQLSSPGGSGQGSILFRPESQRDSKAAALPSSPSLACRGSGSAATAARNRAISTMPGPGAPLPASMCTPASGQAGCKGRRHQPIVFSLASGAGQAQHSIAGGGAAPRKGAHVPTSAAGAAVAAPARTGAAATDGEPTSPAGAEPTTDAATTQLTATPAARQEAERNPATMAQRAGAPIVSATVDGAETAAPAPAVEALSLAAQLPASDSPAGPALTCQQVSQLPDGGASLPSPAPKAGHSPGAEAPNQVGWEDHVLYHDAGKAQATAEDGPAKAPADDSESGIAPFTFSDYVAL